jgi:hypothetical protein
MWWLLYRNLPLCRFGVEGGVLNKSPRDTEGQLDLNGEGGLRGAGGGA